MAVGYANRVTRRGYLEHAFPQAVAAARFIRHFEGKKVKRRFSRPP
jgi:hypothetical protein